MPRTALVALGEHVPDRAVTNEELSRTMDTSDAWIQERTGIRERHRVREGTENSDLAHEAAKRGDLVALCAFGAGFTWASALIRW